tara:strand:- start:153 stop:1793 length:1641 start_codon:yes stop_codon:yes gene_type:complete
MPIQQMVLVPGGVVESDPWYSVFGPNYNSNHGSNIRLDSARNIIVVSGETYTTKVTKIKNDGNILWTKTIRGTNANYGLKAGRKRQGLAIDSSDNIYITDGVGYNYSTHNGLRDGDYTLIKLNSSGAIQWQKGIITSYQGNSYGWGTEVGGVETDPSGNVYITGAAYHSSKTCKPFLIKFNSSGTLQWQRELVQGSGASACQGTCLLYVPARAAHTHSGGASIAAQDEGILLYGYGSFTGFFSASQSCFLTKFDVNGNYDWGHVYYHQSENHKTNEDENTSQLLTQNPTTGDIFISGETGAYGSTRTWTSKLKPDGRYSGGGQWSQKYGHTGHVNSAIAYDPTNNYTIEVGYRRNYAGSASQEQGQYHIRNASNGGVIGKGYLTSSGTGAFNSATPANQQNRTIDNVVCDDKGNFYLLGNVQNYTAPNSNYNIVVWKLTAQQNWPYTTPQSYVGYNVDNWVGTGWSQPGGSSYHHNGRFGLSNGFYDTYPNNEPPDVSYSYFASTDITSDSTRFTSSSSSFTIVTSQYSAFSQGAYNYEVVYGWPA